MGLNCCCPLPEGPAPGCACVGEYPGELGEYAGLVGEYAGEVGEYFGDVGL